MFFNCNPAGIVHIIEVTNLFVYVCFPLIRYVQPKFLLQNMRWHSKEPNLLFLPRLDWQCWRRCFQSRSTAVFVVWAGQRMEDEQVALGKAGGVLWEAPTLGSEDEPSCAVVCCRMDVHLQGHWEAAVLSLGRVKWCPRNFTSCHHSSADVAPGYFFVARFPFSYIVHCGPKGTAIC